MEAIKRHACFESNGRICTEAGFGIVNFPGRGKVINLLDRVYETTQRGESGWLNDDGVFW